MFKNVSKPFLGFLQASGLVSYILIISTFFNNAERIFDKSSSEQTAYIAPIIMLLLFTMSAVISALLVLGWAGALFWEKKY